MSWSLYTDDTATAAAYEAALERTFGTAAGEARYDRAQNGSRPDYPLYSAYVAKNKAAGCWFTSNYSGSRPPGSAAKLRSSFL